MPAEADSSSGASWKCVVSSPDDPCECAEDSDCERDCVDGCDESDVGTKRRRVAADVDVLYEWTLMVGDVGGGADVVGGAPWERGGDDVLFVVMRNMLSVSGLDGSLPVVLALALEDVDEDAKMRDA